MMESEVLKWVVQQGVGVGFGLLVLYIAIRREREFTTRYQKDSEHWVLVAQKIEQNYMELSRLLIKVVQDNATAMQHLSDTLDNRICPFGADIKLPASVRADVKSALGDAAR